MLSALITTWDSPYLSVRNDEADAFREDDRSLWRRGEEALREIIVSRAGDCEHAGTNGEADSGAGRSFSALCVHETSITTAAALRKRSNRIYNEAHLGGGTAESLLGREVGMIGFGRIGRALVEMLRGFDVRWRVYDPFASREL